jgi:hypothetical protein
MLAFSNGFITSKLAYWQTSILANWHTGKSFVNAENKKHKKHKKLIYYLKLARNTSARNEF